MKTTDAFSPGKTLNGTILGHMNDITKCHRNFISNIFLLCLSMGGRFNSLQMGREGEYCEHAHRNNFEKGFDVLKFNKELIKQNTSRQQYIGKYFFMSSPPSLNQSASAPTR